MAPGSPRRCPALQSHHIPPGGPAAGQGPRAALAAESAGPGAKWSPGTPCSKLLRILVWPEQGVKPCRTLPRAGSPARTPRCRTVSSAPSCCPSLTPASAHGRPQQRPGLGPWLPCSWPGSHGWQLVSLASPRPAVGAARGHVPRPAGGRQLQGPLLVGKEGTHHTLARGQQGQAQPHPAMRGDLWVPPSPPVARTPLPHPTHPVTGEGPQAAQNQPPH